MGFISIPLFVSILIIASFGTIFLTLEGHGREELDNKVDLSKTIGWLTSMFPVKLKLFSTSKDAIISAKKIKIKESEALLRLSGGDGRKLLNIFELVVNASPEGQIVITNDKVLELVQHNTVLYDKTG